MRRLTKIKVAGVVGGAMLAVGGASAVVAQAAGSPSPSPSPGGKAATVCQDYASHLAGNLGVDPSRLASANQNAISQALSDAVNSKLLTQKRADAIKARLTKTQGCQIRLWLGQPAELGNGVVVDAAAQALNMSASTLRVDLTGGQTVSQVAPSGTSEAQFAAGFQADLKAELDASVKAHKLGQDAENKILARAPQMANRLWSQGLSKSR